MEGWYCAYSYDNKEDGGDYTDCELCGYEGVRYVHVMAHRDWPDPIEVGCVCAGVMEGDELAPKERERVMRNRAARKRNFLNRNWRPTRYGGLWLREKGTPIFINRSGRRFYVKIPHTGGDQVAYLYHGKSILSMEDAIYAAYDLIDPPPNTDYYG